MEKENREVLFFFFLNFEFVDGLVYGNEIATSAYGLLAMTQWGMATQLRILNRQSAQHGL